LKDVTNTLHRACTHNSKHKKVFRERSWKQKKEYEKRKGMKKCNE